MHGWRTSMRCGEHELTSARHQCHVSNGYKVHDGCQCICGTKLVNLTDPPYFGYEGTLDGSEPLLHPPYIPSMPAAPTVTCCAWTTRISPSPTG